MKAIYIGLVFLGCSTMAYSQWSSHLPIISIETEDEIKNNSKVRGKFRIYWKNGNQNSTLDTPYLVVDKGIEYRGRSSLRFPKKSMAIEIRNTMGIDSSLAIFEMPRASDWVLHNPYSDKSLIRNALVYDLAGDIMDYAPRTRFVELEVNGDYYGVGLFTERIQALPGRVPMKKVGKDAKDGNAVTGGYVLKFDKGNRSERVWTSTFPSSQDDDEYVSVLAHDPPKRELNSEQQDYLEDYLEDFDQLMFSPEYNDPLRGYERYIDVGSLIDYTIFSELTRNVDAYRISTYFYKANNVDGGRLHFGPVWDYNIALGNANYCEGYDHRGWAWDFNYVCDDDDNFVHFWWEKWARDSSFQEKFRSRWKELRTGMLSDASVLSRIDSLVNVIGPAADRNFQRWPVLGRYVWPNDFIGETYEDEIDHLRSWLLRRMSWMDEAIREEYFFRGTVRGLESISLRPNPTNGPADIHFVSRHPGPLVTIYILNDMGQHIQTLPRIEPEFNEGSVSWDPPGAGLYFLRFEIDGRIVETRRLLVQ
jgi:hypothetical protein